MLLKATISRRCLLAFLPWIMMVHDSEGVIVAGTSGAGNNNNTQAGLNDYLSISSNPAFPYWENLVRVSNASGVYLGFNETTSRGWVLSADHIQPEPTSITVGGNSYTVQNSIGTKIGTTDLVLYEIGGGVSDPALPTLTTVPLASSSASLGEFNLMFGRGFTTNGSASEPFPWGAPGDDDNNGMRWGTNTSLGYTLVNDKLCIATDFSSTLDLSVTEYEAQGANGDSGGGLFAFRSGQWELSGIAYTVASGLPENSSEFGDFTFYSDVRSQINNIQTITGTLIPEPSSLWFVLSGIGLLCRRRR